MARGERNAHFSVPAPRLIYGAPKFSRLRLIKQIRRAIEIVLFTKNVSAQSLSILKQLLTTSGKSGKTKSPFLDSDSDLSFCVVLANNGFNRFSLSLTG